MKPPKKDQEIGMKIYATKIPGLGGKIKQSPEDFVVEEITPNGFILKSRFVQTPKTREYEPKGKGEYTLFTLEKKNWPMLKAIKTLAKKIGVSEKRFGFAGTKDKVAITTQRISAWKIPQERLEKIQIKDIELRDFHHGQEIKLGDLWGNRFTLTIREIDLKREEIEKRAREISKTKEFPNFFGPQRFGARLNNHLIGKAILKGQFEEGAKIFLTDSTHESDAKVMEARQWLEKNWGEYEEALKIFPIYLRYERAILHHLAKYPRDYVNAFKRLPKSLFKMFTHAYQGYLFNLITSKIFSPEGGQAILPGYETKFSEFKDIEEEILEREGISLENFKIRSFPEASCKGELRKILVKPRNLNFKVLQNALQISFELKAGSYATVILREFMKN